jgi:membrane peptidoglycan carboxypeptidase
VLAVLGVVLVATGAAAWFSSPTPSALAARVEGRLQGTSGRPVTLSQISRILQQAVIATEDERFYRHHGIDVIGLVRAIPYDITHLSFAQGASTITEQVAKILYLRGNDHTPWLKLRDAALALEIESRYSKGQILTAYLNSVYFGDHAYGIWAASERYFGVRPGRLGTAQASLLAGLIQAPSAYDPFRHGELARARQVEVLRTLVRDRALTEKQAAAALAQPLRLRDGTILEPVTGVDLSAGPAFNWWELTLGTAIALLGLVALAGTRLLRVRDGKGLLAIRLALVVVAVIGAAIVARSFRTA